MVRIPTDREPTHPGELLLQEFLQPLGMTQRDLSNAIQVPYQRVKRSRPGETRCHTPAPPCDCPGSSALLRISG